ncbi:glycosyltransferase family 2 protein [Breznakia pachnodae]|uniref:Glycosyltransferase involved in cell wall biosynthesis n=1 Tax=Breznakia pachnodae TaxID=265178 RepID=A0ABU0DZ75_9FIRM|nr:glycosyltransferase family 2 protein [Breznakia pachnodae]MDQ0359783.1 glycosyltransferase involved in cell wall biosynthesis [Breznakia pachnodae]
MGNQKISLIMPVYNSEKYLEESLQSVFQQSYKNFNLIIMDDGSTDGSNTILRDWEKKYPDVIKVYTQENQGQSAARNNALNYADGEFISFVDSDDILESTMLEELMNEVDDTTDIVACAYEKFISETNEITLTRLPLAWWVEFDATHKHLFHYTPCAKLFRTDFLKRFDIKFSVGEQLEDGPYCCMSDILARSVKVIDFVGYHYRIHSSSTMGNVRKKGGQKPKVPYNGVRQAVATVRNHNTDEIKDKILEYCIIKILAGLTTNMYKNCDKETRKEICEFCYSFIKDNFPNVKKNPYVGFFKLKQLPLTHRVATKLFVLSYRMHLLYPFSLIVSKVL